MKFLTGLAALFTAGVLSAQSQTAPAPLSLDDCIRMAQSAQSSVTIARQQTEIARYGVTQARAGFLPQASIGNSFAYNSPANGVFTYVAMNGVHEYSILGNIGLELDTSGRLRAQLARARADQDAASAGVVLSQRDLRRVVTASYYRVLLARHLVEVARAALAEAQNFERRTRLLVANGEAAQADNIKAASEVAFLQQAVNAAELEAKLANHDLASFWTTEVEDTLKLADTLDRPVVPPEAPPASGSPYRGRPEFRLFDAQMRGLQADARRARADLYPQLSVVWQYGIDSLRVNWADRGYAAFVNLNIPVFDWFRARSATRQFRLQAQQVNTSSQISERTFSRDYRDALSRVEAAFAQISITESQVKLSEDNYRLSQVRYEGGEGLALDVVTAQTQLAQARANYFTTKANYWNAQTDLEVASGK